MKQETIDLLTQTIIDVPDFPKPGILFKDITPIFQNPELINRMLDELEEYYRHAGIEAVAGLESRGFLLGMPLALRLRVPFILMRKKNKLPRERFQVSYDLEYGQEIIEMHKDALRHGQRVLVHDDVLATGGTAEAAARLIKQAGAEVAGFSFIAEITFLEGRKKLVGHSEQISTFAGF